MKKTKIVFFDIDGTLIDMDANDMTSKMVNTLMALRENDIKICIATGRPKALLPTFSEVEFDAFLTFNGSYSFTREDVIYENSIPKKDVMQIVENAAGMNRYVTLAGKSRVGSNGSDPNLKEYCELSGNRLHILEDFEAFMMEDIYQVMVGVEKHEYDQILENVDGAQITAWWPRAVDVIPVGGGKGVAVNKVLDYYGFSKEEALAFGDGTNDIDMLKAVGTGVAMGNATRDVKEAADIICKNCNEDGIYHYCLEQGMIPEL